MAAESHHSHTGIRRSTLISLPLALQSEITPENWAQIVTFRTLRRELALDGAKIQ